METVEPVDSMYRQFGGRCLVLRGALTVEECTYLTAQMEGDLSPVHYREDYRRNDRCIFESPELAELLWRRVEPFAAPLAVAVEEDYSRQHLASQEAVGG